MVCTNCNRDVPDYSNFCSFCGARQQVFGGQARACKRLMRSSVDRKIAGVCGGVAEYFEIDSTLVRLIWVLLMFVPVPLFPGIAAYVVGWLIMPVAPLPVTKTAEPPAAAPHSAQTA